MPLKLLFSVFISLISGFHPFHVSVCDIEHDPQTKALQISQRIFMDDLAVGLQTFHNMDYVDTYAPEDVKKLDSLIGEYIKAKLFIVVDGKEAKLNYLGSELEGDARWCYLEVSNIASVSELDISNVILFETFTDQENIVHVKVKDALKSYKLNKKELSHTFKFDK